MLNQGVYSAKDMSRILGIREREVYEHLPHVEKSLGKGISLIVEPARCLDCDFVFNKRRRFTTPGRCPICHSESISPPLYGIRDRC
jgi:transcriptional regulator